MLKRFLGPLVLLAVLAACTPSAPPAISATVSPGNGDVNVPVTAVVTAVFNVAINESTVDGAFSLSSAAGEVAGVLTYDATLRTATFTPSAPLAYDTEYTAAVAGTIRSTAGGRLPVPTTGEYAWSFTTESEPSVTPGVVAVEVSPATAELELGDTEQFSVDVVAVGGADESVTWSSSDEDVATVSTGGLVTAVGEGEATITATSVFNTGVSGSAVVTVVDPTVIPDVTAVEVSPATAELEVDETLQLAVDVTAVGGASEAVTWESSDEDVATVDDDGLVTAVGEGEATITATSVFNTGVSGDAVVTVTEPVVDPEVLSVTVSPDDFGLLVDETRQLGVTVDVVGGASQDVTWSSSDDDVATVVDGLVTAVSAGTATITATSVAAPGISGSATVTVDDVPVVVSVTIEDPGDVYETDIVTLQADVVVVGPLSQDVTWTSSDEEVATIDLNTGELTAVAPGTTTITATSVEPGGLSNTLELTVLAATVTEVVISPSTVEILDVGDDVPFSEEVTAFGGADDTVTWLSSNEAVAEIDPVTGLLVALAPGTTEVTAESNFPGGPTSDPVTVDVRGVTDVSVAPASTDLEPGDTQLLSATVTAFHGADDSVTWVSSDDLIATVDAEGLVTAVAGGTVTITATSNFDLDVSGSATINVQTVTDVTIDPATLDLAVAGSDTLVATVTVTGDADQSVTWSSSDDLIATVDADGLVTAVAVGEATITATSVFDTAFSGTATVTVHDLPVADDYDTEVGYLEGTLVEIDAPEVTGGLAPFSFEVTGGALPDGVELEEDGSISFTPAVTGANVTYTGTVTVTDALGQTDEADFSIVVVGVLVTVGATDVHPDFVAGTEIDPIALVVSGGLAPFTYEVVACDPLDAAFAAFDCTDEFGDALPPGLDIDEDGNLAGTPTLAEFYRSYVVLTDAIGQESAPLQFEIDVDMDLFWSQSSYQYPLGFTTDTAYHDAANYAVLIPGTGFAMTLFGLDEPAWTVIGNTGTLAFTWELLTGGGLSNARWHIGGTTGTIFRNMNSLTNNTAANHNSNRTYRITVTDGATGRTASFDLSFEVVPVIEWTPIWVPVP